MTAPNQFPTDSLKNPLPPQGQAIILEPGVPLELAPDRFLADTAEIQAKLGVGFSGTLRAIVECDPGDGHEGDLFYVFDRGSNSGIEPIANLMPEKMNLYLSPEARFVVMTEEAVEKVSEVAIGNQSLKLQVGWGGFEANTGITVGRNAETGKRLKMSHTKATLSREHFDLALGGDGRITVIDLDSTNGTAVYS